MDNPIKVIYKYKNSNRRTQYNLYIFVGNIHSDKIIKILKKIKDKNLFDTLIFLNGKEADSLVKVYGEFWYMHFFNNHHISFSINNIKKSKQKKKDIISKYGKKWYDTHIENYKIKKPTEYNYNAFIKDERKEKIAKLKLKERLELEQEIDKITEIDDYRTKNIKLSQIGGSTVRGVGTESTDLSSVEDKEVVPTDKVGDVQYDQLYAKDKPEPITQTPPVPTVDIDATDEFDLEELDKMFKEPDVEQDKDVTNTTKLINKILSEQETKEILKQDVIPFDNTKWNDMYDDDLKNIFKKNYIFHQYIFADDTIKITKQKICTSIALSANLIGNIKHSPYLIPSRQYMWSEYKYKDNKTGKTVVDKVMLGQKWIRRNELLAIDIEPNNNIHIYENLRGNLKSLRDNIKKYGSKIKREEDENNLILDYVNYTTNNEIFMVDIYNELGINYGLSASSVQIKNLFEVYVKIYFFHISFDDFKSILDYLNIDSDDTKKDRNLEINKMQTIYKTINNDLTIENEIVKSVELVKKTPGVYQKLFRPNYITQSVIHTTIHQIGKPQDSKIDIFRIFDNFIVNEKYPFLEYQTTDGQLIFKFSNDITKLDKNTILSKWFENAPYGISFKIRIKGAGEDKYIAIKLQSNGRVEYKTQWKEEDKATISDIKKTYNYVKDLIRKINKENRKLELAIPTDDKFQFAFINTIQQFELPEKFTINHNDLSDFSRYFYPYVALVIEPRKRRSKMKKGEEESKYGTYLRYKRITKYDNEAKIEHRVVYFLRNYEFNLKALANEISKQFNITEKKATEHIEKVRIKYPVIKKSRKVLKKFENIPKYKPPGIGIDIQGKTRTKYKMRISGARNKQQLDRMVTFMNILIYLYIETYLYKNKNRQRMKDMLKKLNNIAKRRNKVRDVVKTEEVVTIKTLTKLDKERIGFKPEKGQNQWTRACQNNGEDKRRQPQLYVDVNELMADGYVLNDKTGDYEKKIVQKNGKKKEIITLTAAKLSDNAGGFIYYTCSPEENGEYKYISFLTRSNNPFGHCMPCCYKKNPALSKNVNRRNYHLKCLGKLEKEVDSVKRTVGDKLYILQDTNKIQEGRFAFLPKLLNIFFNQMLNKTKTIKNHYLVRSKTGYFFKYGTHQQDFPFINAVIAAFDLTVPEIKTKITKVLEDDKIYTSLNNGDIKTQFGPVENYVNYIHNNEHLDIDTMHDILTIPGVLHKDGINIFMFEKRIFATKDEFNKKRVSTDYVLICTNIENNHQYYDKKRKNIFIIKDGKLYNAIFLVIKDDKVDKNIRLQKTFDYDEKDEMNIVNMILKYHKLSCSQSLFDDNTISYATTNNAKNVYKKLVDINKSEYTPKYQVIDDRNKCKYIITKNNTIVPVTPSGCLYHLRILKNLQSVHQSLNETIKKLMQLYKVTNKNIPSKPMGVYYSEKTDNNYKVEAVMTQLKLDVPVKPVRISKKELQRIAKSIGIKEFMIQEVSIHDEEITKGRSNIVIDKRILDVNKRNYLDESYNLFRLELSEYLQKNTKVYNDIEKIVDNPKTDNTTKRKLLKKILYKISSKSLYDVFRGIQTGGEKFVHLYKKERDQPVYEIENHRNLCSIHKKKDKCNSSYHCRWGADGCLFSLSEEMLVEFINKVAEELLDKDLKAKELLQKEDYYVSNIVSRTRFRERENQKIIKSDNYNMNRILGEIFGEANIPKIGRRKVTRLNKTIDDESLEHPLKTVGNIHVQDIINNNNTLFRAFSNGYYWLQNSLYDTTYRNIGYYSDLQTDLSNYFRSTVIDWLNNRNNKGYIEKHLMEYFEAKSVDDFIEKFVIHVSKNADNVTTYNVELAILHSIYKTPIIVYDNYNKIIRVHNNNTIITKKTTKYEETDMKKKSINIKFITTSGSNIPNNIQVLYFI